MGKRKKVVWSEPQLPPYVKINPDSPPGHAEGLQPGDISMGAVAEEFSGHGREGAAPALGQLRSDGIQRGPDVLDGVRVREPQVALAVRAEGSAAQGGHARVLEQPGLQLRRRSARCCVMFGNT